MIITATMADRQIGHMTALERYQRLEAIGIWRLSRHEEGREVLVQFGKSTLVLNATDDAPLTHWSIPAISVRKRGETETLYALDSDGDETLLIGDRDMRAALDEILGSKTQYTDAAPAGRARWVNVVLVVLALIGAAILFPLLLSNFSHKLVSPENAARISEQMITLIEERAGPRCNAPLGRLALDQFAMNLFPDQEVKADVIDIGDATAILLPGPHIILGQQLVEGAKDPSELAKWATLAANDGASEAVFAKILNGGNWYEIFNFWFSGTISDSALDRTVNRLLLEERVLPAEAPQADPRLTDNQWVALQEICSG